MYACYQNGIAADRRESFSATTMLAENALYLATWIIAGWLLVPLRVHGIPIATLAWAAVVAVVQALLKKHNCSGCYYYGKLCHLGWGKLSAWMFPRDSGDVRMGMRLSLFYVVSPPLLLMSGVMIGVFLRVGVLHWILLATYVALNIVTFPVRIRGCRVCAMRLVCPGSAAKQA
jgi:hypothetical protein